MDSRRISSYVLRTTGILIAWLFQPGRGLAGISLGRQALRAKIVGEKIKPLGNWYTSALSVTQGETRTRTLCVMYPYSKGVVFGSTLVFSY